MMGVADCNAPTIKTRVSQSWELKNSVFCFELLEACICTTNITTIVTVIYDLLKASNFILLPDKTF